MSRIYLSDKDKIEKFENHLVKATLADGTVLEGLEPRRLFPVSNPNAYVTLLDESGVEKAVIRALSDLDKESAAIINASLDDY